MASISTQTDDYLCGDVPPSPFITPQLQSFTGQPFVPVTQFLSPSFQTYRGTCSVPQAKVIQHCVHNPPAQSSRSSITNALKNIRSPVKLPTVSYSQSNASAFGELPDWHGAAVVDNNALPPGTIVIQPQEKAMVGSVSLIDVKSEDDEDHIEHSISEQCQQISHRQTPREPQPVCSSLAQGHQKRGPNKSSHKKSTVCRSLLKVKFAANTKVSHVDGNVTYQRLARDNIGSSSHTTGSPSKRKSPCTNKASDIQHAFKLMEPQIKLERIDRNLLSSRKAGNNAQMDTMLLRIPNLTPESERNPTITGPQSTIPALKVPAVKRRCGRPPNSGSLSKQKKPRPTQVPLPGKIRLPEKNSPSDSAIPTRKTLLSKKRQRKPPKTLASENNQPLINSESTISTQSLPSPQSISRPPDSWSCLNKVLDIKKATAVMHKTGQPLETQHLSRLSSDNAQCKKYLKPSVKEKKSSIAEASNQRASNILRRKSYDFGYKLKVANYAIKVCNKQKAAFTFGVSEKQVRDWISQKDMIETWHLNKKQLRLSSGPPQCQARFADHESQLVRWFRQQWLQGARMSDTMLMQKMREICPDPSFKASTGWVRRFKKRNKLTCRKKSCIGGLWKSEPTDHGEVSAAFLTCVSTYVDQHHYSLTNIFALDEVDFQFDPLQTQPSVSKSISCEISERGFVLLLGAAADGRKLKPWVIFRSQFIPRCRRDDIIFKSSKDGHISNKVCLDRTSSIFGAGNDGGRRLLVWDSNSAHLAPGVQDKLQQNCVDVAVIPSGISHSVHPLHTGILKGMKSHLQQNWCHWATSQAIPPQCDDFLEWILAAWEAVLPSDICAGFRTRIINPQNCTFKSDDLPVAETPPIITPSSTVCIPAVATAEKPSSNLSKDNTGDDDLEMNHNDLEDDESEKNNSNLSKGNNGDDDPEMNHSDLEDATAKKKHSNHSKNNTKDDDLEMNHSDLEDAIAEKPNSNVSKGHIEDDDLEIHHSDLEDANVEIPNSNHSKDHIGDDDLEMDYSDLEDESSLPVPPGLFDTDSSSEEFLGFDRSDLMSPSVQSEDRITERTELKPTISRTVHQTSEQIKSQLVGDMTLEKKKKKGGKDVLKKRKSTDKKRAVHKNKKTFCSLPVSPSMLDSAEEVDGYSVGDLKQKNKPKNQKYIHQEQEQKYEKKKKCKDNDLFTEHDSAKVMTKNRQSLHNHDNMDDNENIIRRRKSYDFGFKLQVANYAIKCGCKDEAARQFGVGGKQVRDWVKQRNQFKLASKQGNTLRAHYEHKAKYAQLEGAVADWFRGQQIKGILVTGRMLTDYICLHFPEAGFKYSTSWHARFKKRYGLSNCLSKSVERKKLSADHMEEASVFRKSIRDLFVQHQYAPCDMYFVDEVPLLFNMPPGRCDPATSPAPAQQWGFTAVLAVAADGSKVRPWVVFNSSQDVTVTRRDIVMRTDCKDYITEKACLEWVQSTFPTGYDGGRQLLVWDSTPCHMHRSVCSHLQDAAVDVTVIPAAASTILQPLNANLIKDFKASLEHIWAQWVGVFGCDTQCVPQPDDIAQWLLQAWESLSAEGIQRSFEKIGLVTSNWTILNNGADTGWSGTCQKESGDSNDILSLSSTNQLQNNTISDQTNEGPDGTEQNDEDDGSDASREMNDGDNNLLIPVPLAFTDTETAIMSAESSPRIKTVQRARIKRCHKSYNVRFKLEVADYAIEIGNKAKAAHKYDIGERQVREWIKQRDQLMQCDKGRKKIVMGASTGKHELVEEMVVKWYTEQRLHGIHVTGDMLQEFMRENCAHDSSFQASKGWLRRFQRRQGLKCWGGLVDGGKTMDMKREVAKIFLKFVHTKCQEKQYLADSICSMEEILMELPRPTIDSPEECPAQTKVDSPDKLPFLVILMAYADGRKAKPWVIFKRENATQLQSKSVIVTFRKNVKITRDVCVKWVQSKFARRGRQLLVWGEHPVHSYSAVRQSLQEHHIDVALIPIGLEDTLQPLRAQLIDDFKTHLLKSWADWATSLNSHGATCTRPQEKQVVRWIKSAWASISPVDIQAAFVKTDIVQLTGNSGDCVTQGNNIFEKDLGDNPCTLSPGDLTASEGGCLGNPGYSIVDSGSTDCGDPTVVSQIDESPAVSGVSTNRTKCLDSAAVSCAVGARDNTVDRDVDSDIELNNTVDRDVDSDIELNNTVDRDVDSDIELNNTVDRDVDSDIELNNSVDRDVDSDIELNNAVDRDVDSDIELNNAVDRDVDSDIELNNSVDRDVDSDIELNNSVDRDVDSDIELSSMEDEGVDKADLPLPPGLFDTDTEDEEFLGF